MAEPLSRSARRGLIVLILKGPDNEARHGNCLAASEHRLKSLRVTAAGPLARKSLVVDDPQLNMALDVFPCADGHTQERALLGEVIPTVEAGDVWVADCHFCVLQCLF
jgi:hypothetical protein